MKKIISILLTLLPPALFAQSAERQVIGSTGGYATGAGIKVSSTVGEAVVTTATSGTIILTQGFQQSGTGGTVGIKDVQTGLSVNASPNPAQGLVMLKINTPVVMEVMVSVYDALGKLTSMPLQKLKVNGESTHEVDFSKLATGNYYLLLSNAEGSLKQTIKIQKID